MTDQQRPTAVIYQFPTRPRQASDSARQQANASTSQIPQIAFGGSWYHEEAIEEADKAHDFRQRRH